MQSLKQQIRPRTTATEFQFRNDEVQSYPIQSNFYLTFISRASVHSSFPCLGFFCYYWVNSFTDTKKHAAIGRCSVPQGPRPAPPEGGSGPDAYRFDPEFEWGGIKAGVASSSPPDFDPQKGVPATGFSVTKYLLLVAFFFSIIYVAGFFCLSDIVLAKCQGGRIRLSWLGRMTDAHFENHS